MLSMLFCHFHPNHTQKLCHFEKFLARKKIVHDYAVATMPKFDNNNIAPRNQDAFLKGLKLFTEIYQFLSH